MAYRDSDVEGVLECTVIGACFILTCNLGRQTATDNLRPLPNFAIPIQVATHREAVLAAAQIIRGHSSSGPAFQDWSRTTEQHLGH